MTTTAQKDWKEEFGVQDRKPPSFFSSLEDIDSAGSAAPQPHALRRAFEQLKIDGVLCQDKSPLIYFRQVDQIDPVEAASIHRLFWNQGVAPVLVLIASDRVEIYSSLAHPKPYGPTDIFAGGFVEKLNRVAEELQTFLLAVETGEYFATHRPSFNPDQRVDRDLLRNLQATRDLLDKVPAARLDPPTLDALLCRLVFTCYLFDRGVIDRAYLEDTKIRDSEHLRDILGRKSRTDAKADLYKLFAQLGQDFNGDLFSDDLDAEARQIKVDHLDIFDRFFKATDVQSGQQSFWPYDFGIIPIETISAIYEHFLKAAGEAEKKEAGAFYTPRFLAELVIDMTVTGVPTLLDKRFLDPACGSGIFLVGLFNRLAEEWNHNNPNASYDAKLRGLTEILKTNLFGIDKNRTACLIAAFSLYLALLDQLSPPDIRRVLRKVKVLPRLVADKSTDADTIRCADFFDANGSFPQNMHYIVGNPPWGSTATEETPAGRWCAAHDKPLPDKQLAAAFVWKAPEHLETRGRVCFVLPHGTLFHFSPTALAYQRAWIRLHAIDKVLNLGDFRWFLFEKAVHPALIVSYRRTSPQVGRHRIEYWRPKADWTVTQTEVINVAPLDRSTLSVEAVIKDLDGPDAPQIWKQNFWATPRDLRLLDRLSLYPRLRDHVRRPKEKHSEKPWIMAVGFQPLGENDDPEKAETIALPSRWFLSALNPAIDLFLLTSDCTKLAAAEVTVRNGSNKNTEVFVGPHVLVTKGFTNACYADFSVSFQDAIRGIHGPRQDSDLLIFLAAYLRTPLAKYFLFHTTSDWGMARPQIHVEETLRLPMPFPDQLPSPQRGREIIKEVSGIVSAAVTKAKSTGFGREQIICAASAIIEPLVNEYFDILPLEKLLIDDTVSLVIQSAQPTHKRMPVPTVRHSSQSQREAASSKPHSPWSRNLRATRYTVVL